MEGGTCILGKTFWSVEGSDSGVEAYVEQSNRKIQLKFYIKDYLMKNMILRPSLSDWLELSEERKMLQVFQRICKLESSIDAL